MDHHRARWKPLLKFMLWHEVGGYQIICAVLSHDEVGRPCWEEFRETNGGKQHLGIAEGITDTFCRRYTRNLHTLESFLLEVECTLNCFPQGTSLSKERSHSYQTDERTGPPLWKHMQAILTQYFTELKSPWLRSCKDPDVIL